MAMFVYGPGGERVKGIVSTGTTPTYYIGAHYEKEGTTVRKYYYAGSQRVAMTESGTLYYLLMDHLGSTSVTADGTTGAWAGEVRYKAWGEDRPACATPPCGTTPTTYRYTGQREESYINMYYYGARWYDPTLGRFTQPDTIIPQAGNPQALNRFSYSFNHPVKYIDPSGHRPCVDTECNWVENRSGWISWAGGGNPSLPKGRYLYSDSYGAFDKSHLNTGSPGQVITDVQKAIAADGGTVTIQQSLHGMTYQQQYSISGDATAGQATAIALGIYENWSVGFELWESSVALLGQNTAFANEDLPSQYVGFFSKSKGISYAEAFMNLGGVEGSNAEPPRSMSAFAAHKNFGFTPRVQNAAGNWSNIPWPDEMTITPIGSESGLWQSMGESCSGIGCLFTTP